MGSGGGGFSSIEDSRGNERQASSSGVMITWSKNNDELRGFSNSLGEWEILKINKQDRIIPVIGSVVAAVRFGDSIAAFSSVKGWWDMIPLSKGSNAVPAVYSDLVSIEDNGHLYTFAAAKGRWTSPTDPELQSFRYEVQSADFRDAVSAQRPFQEWLESLPRYKARGIRTQFRGSGITCLYLERRSLLEDTKSALIRAFKSHETSGTPQASPTPDLDVPQAEAKIADLRVVLQQLELAVRESSGTKDSSTEKNDDQQRELRKLVEKAFDLRQQMQRLEAQRMKLKLQLIETNLDAREKTREAIIERRVSDLQQSHTSSGGAEDVPHSKLSAEKISFNYRFAPWSQVLQDFADFAGCRLVMTTVAPTGTLSLMGTSEYTADEALEILSRHLQPEGFSLVRKDDLLICMKGVTGMPIRLPGPPQSSIDVPATLDSAGIRPSNSDSRIQWPQPGEIVKELRKYRSDFLLEHRGLRLTEREVNRWSQKLETLIEKGKLEPDATEEQRESELVQAKQFLVSKQNNLDKLKRDWDYAWSAYQSKLHLLKLDVAVAKATQEALQERITTTGTDGASSRGRI